MKYPPAGGHGVKENKMEKRKILTKRIVLILGISLFFTSLIFAGPNENAGITFDLNATTTGNQNLIQIPEPGAGDYIRVDVYAQDVVNLDTYEFEVIYNQTRLQYITATPTNPITYEPNILTTNGGEALGWMIDTSTQGVLSIAYTLAGSDTLEAPEGEGLVAHVVFQALITESSYLSFGNVYYHDSYGTMDVITNKGMAFLGGVPPMPPADLTAYTDTVLQNSIRLNWIDPTENIDGTPLDDLAGINIYYSDSTFITSVEPGVETYAVQGLTCGEYYSFYVTAYDNETPVNESLPGNTAGAALIAPMPPSDFSVYSDYTTPNSIQLTWTDPTQNIDLSPLTDLNHIDVYYSDGTLIDSVNPGVETYIDEDLTDGQLYGYYLVPVANNSNGAGNGRGPAQFIISLTDYAGEGWGFNNSIDLLVNGVVVLDDITLISGYGPENHPFLVDDGDSVFVDYRQGSYNEDNAYYVYDNIGCLVVYSGGYGDVPDDVSFIAAPKPFCNTTDTLSWHAGGSPIPSSPTSLVDDDTLNNVILTWIDPTTQEDGTPLDDLAGINIYYADSSFIASVAPGVETYTVSELIPNHIYSFYVTAYDNETPVNESSPSNTTVAYTATLLYVHPDSTLNSIQTALDLCSMDDTVLVAAGTYYENIVWPISFPWNIHLVSESGPDSTIIDGGGNGNVIWMHTGGPGSEDNHPRIEGFTLQNGNANAGGGIRSVGWGKATIIGNIITNNTTIGPGGGIRCNGSLIIIGNTITNNSTSGGDGGGIYMGSGSTDIIDNTISNNTAGEGGGIYLQHYVSSVTISGNTITNNTSTYSSRAGIVFTGCSPTLIDNIITDNNGWGIGNTYWASATVDHCIISGNTSGGVYIYGASSISITNSVISNNGGDGIYAGDDCDGSAHYSDIYNNVGFGVYHTGCWHHPVFYAQYNWWGDPLGPFGPNGDGIHSGPAYFAVPYEPWLTEPAILRTVSVPDYSNGEPGDTLSIPVNTTDLTGYGVLSAEFTLSYEPTIITGIDVDASGTLLSWTDWTWDYTIAGDSIHVSMAGTDTLSGSGTLINLLFVVSPDAATGDISSLHFENFVYNEGFPQVYTEDGIFIVGEMFGAIEGTVTDAATSIPIVGAVVTALGTFTYCDTTDANGYYLMPELFIIDTYDMTVTASGYNTIDTTGIVVIGGETTDVNFSMLHPEISVNPSSFDVEIPVDTTYSTLMTISNAGNGPLDFTISIGEDADFVKSVGVNPDGISKIPQSRSRRFPSIQQGLPRGINPIQRGITYNDNSSEGIDRDGFIDIFQLSPNSDNNNPEPEKGLLRPSPYEETIHYDEENSAGVGLVCGCTFEGAIRLTPDELGPYNEWELISVLFYYFASDTYSGQIKIYGAGSSAEPGALITSEPYYVNESEWYRIDLTEPVTIDATQDLWTSVEIAGYNYPLGVDAGPAVQGKGDFVYHNGWSELYLFDIDRNWNIRAIVAPKLLYVTPDSGMVPADQSLDITVTFDTHGLTPDYTYTTNILIHNNSADSPVDIPVTMHITSFGVGDSPAVLSNKLNPNFPNPFNPDKIETTISFSLKEKGDVKLSVYNIKGQLVATLVDEKMDPGADYKIIWDGKSGNKKLASGIYFYKLETRNKTFIKKMIMMR